ncbi:MAG TPA: HRDC domain-containing protein, partial [Microbacteriaceae bacterium]|nr:HRDC domain-containing protein [Microbacteriaceae bacterium]
AAELAAPPAAPRRDPWRRLSGIHAVKGRRRLAVARALWGARDGLARQKDVSPGRVLPDSALVAAAMAMPASRHDLLGIKGFTGRGGHSHADLWWAAVEEGRTTDDLPSLKKADDATPPARSWKHHNAAAAARLDAAKAALRLIGEEQRIPVENLVRPATVRALAWQPPEEPTVATVDRFLAEHDARRWQRALVAAVLSQAMHAVPAAPDELDSRGPAAGPEDSAAGAAAPEPALAPAASAPPAA